MHAGLYLIQGGGASRKHEVVAVHNAPDAEPLVEVAARRRAALREADVDQLLGEEGLPPLRCIPRAVQAADEPRASLPRRLPAATA